MKKLLLLLFIPIVCFGQPQIHNDIELNGPKGFIKISDKDFTWEKGNESVTVTPISFVFTEKQKETLLKQESRGLTFLFSQKVDAPSGPITLAVFKSQSDNNQTLFLGKCLEEKKGYNYLITTTSLCTGDEYETPLGSDRTLGQASITQLFYITGYMAERIRIY